MKDIELIPLDELSHVSGGLTPQDQIRYTSAKCPVPGCGFECSGLGDLNVHMRTCHPERFGR